jgi:hypothetical protein
MAHIIDASGNALMHFQTMVGKTIRTPAANDLANGNDIMTRSIGSSNSCGVTGMTKVTPANCPTGIDESSSALQSILIYPDPVLNELTISFSPLLGRGAGGEALMDIYNILGEKVLSRTFIGNACSLSLGEGRGEALNISNLSAGIYFLQMKTEIGIDTKRFVKE